MEQPRAYIHKYKVMVDIQRVNYDTNTVECYLVSEDEGDLSEFNFNEVDILSYTGLEDAYGTRVYEGDILSDEDGEISIVVFDEGMFQIRYDTLLTTLADNIEGLSVIGDIYRHKSNAKHILERMRL